MARPSRRLIVTYGLRKQTVNTLNAGEFEQIAALLFKLLAASHLTDFIDSFLLVIKGGRGMKKTRRPATKIKFKDGVKGKEPQGQEGRTSERVIDTQVHTDGLLVLELSEDELMLMREKGHAFKQSERESEKEKEVSASSLHLFRIRIIRWICA